MKQSNCGCLPLYFVFLDKKNEVMATITDLSQLDLNGTYSYADYIKWQFEERVELLRGKISPMSPAPSIKHQ